MKFQRVWVGGSLAIQFLTEDRELSVGTRQQLKNAHPTCVNGQTRVRTLHQSFRQQNAGQEKGDISYFLLSL